VNQQRKCKSANFRACFAGFGGYSANPVDWRPLTGVNKVPRSAPLHHHTKGVKQV